MELRIFIEPQEGAGYEQQLRFAQAAERLGFDGFFRSDHLVALDGDEGLPGPTDSWVTLAGLARETKTLRLGTLVTAATFRWPGLLAISVAQVDAMSGGRVELGLGAGWHEVEHLAQGIPFPPQPERIDRLEEQLEILTGIWSTPPGESFDFEGSHYRLQGCPALPRPAQSPRPPLIVGGTGPKRTPRLAARFADEYNAPFIDPEEAAAQYLRVEQACEELGRDPATIVRSAALEASGLAPAELIDQLSGFAAAGATRAYLQLLDLDDLDQLELLAAEVLPALR